MDVFEVSAVDDFIAGHVLELGVRAHAEGSYKDVPFDGDKLVEVATRYASGDSTVFFLALDGDKPVGAFAGMLDEFYFSRALVAIDVIWYVMPEYRGTHVGLKLLEMFETWAKNKGAKEIRVGQSTNINPKVFNGILEKRGYDFVGANYRMET